MSKESSAGFRSDIQGLRAIAVLLVMIFHVWPGALTGGYVGVDVFFVISGFLITGLLVKEFEKTGGISLPSFYARRIRRLLPAASATLIAVAIAAYAWLPPALWSDLSKELIASGFYVENFLLVRRSVDYLALEAAPSPVQHYWSLSIEEQFYIIWPLVMLAAGWLARRRGWSLRKTFLVALGAIVVTSLGWSIYASFVDPAPGYFLTTTRLWELGTGGLIALAQRGRIGKGPLQAAAGWAGILAIIGSAYYYNSTLPFPGYEALLPTLGAGLLISTASEPESALGRLLGHRWLQYLGDISYSLYLWHWPVVVFYPYATGNEATDYRDGVVVIGISVLLAHVSKGLIEDRFRHPSTRGRERLRAYTIGAACMSGVAAIAISLFLVNSDKSQETNLADNPAYPGAEAMLGKKHVPAAPFRPELAAADLDRGTAYVDGNGDTCITQARSSELGFCRYGPRDGKFKIILVGDSHTAHWLPAFERVAVEHRWNFTGLSKDSCAFADVTVDYGRAGQPMRPYTECSQWNQKVLTWIQDEKPDLVIISISPFHRVDGKPARESQRAVAQGAVVFAKQIERAGIKVAAIKHTPRISRKPALCMSGKHASIEACSDRRTEALRMGSLNIAAMLDPSITLLNFDDAFCDASNCAPIIGNVVVYRDNHHMTATFARTLSKALYEKVAAIDPKAK